MKKYIKESYLVFEIKYLCIFKNGIVGRESFLRVDSFRLALRDIFV